MFSETKSITDDYDELDEIINDLESGTTYFVGVLIITDDGDFNDQDIVYGEYKTLCIRKYISIHHKF